MDSEKGSGKTLLILAPLAALVSILLPFAFIGREVWFVRPTISQPNLPFELFGLLVSLFSVAFLVGQGRQLVKSPDWKRGTTVVTVLLALHYLPFFTNIARPTWDYRCFDQAARAVIDGQNPYLYESSETWYLYPPLLAQVLVKIHGWVVSLHLPPSRFYDSWWLVFFIFQCIQYYLLLLAIWLSFRLIRQLKVPSLYTVVLVVFFFLLNSPLFRTLRGCQTNLFMLNCILLSLILTRRQPLLAGAFIALACQIKPHVLLFPLAWLLTKRFRALLGFAISFVLLVLIQADFGRDWTTWKQYLAFASSAPPPVENTFFRNSSLFAVLSNLGSFLGLGADPRVIWPLVWTSFAVFLVIFTVRFQLRERIFRDGIADLSPKEIRNREFTFRFHGHATDMLVIGLLLAPLVWEHHFLMILPVLMWGFGVRQGIPPVGLILAALLILVPTTFDVFPLGVNKLAGTMLLLWQISPGRIWKSLNPNIPIQMAGEKPTYRNGKT
jgi:hypothetical protein